MPIYTFRCPKCRYKFTDMFSMKEANGENLVCPRCRSKNLERVWEGSFSIRKNSCSACSSGVCGLNRWGGGK